MFKHKIEYTDYLGNKREMKVAFNLNAIELIELQRSTPGGYGELLMRVAESGDGLEMWAVFEDLVKRGYGEISEDGVHFLKTDAEGNRLVENFVNTPAYEAFMIDLITNPENLGANFINALIPKESVDKVKAMMSAAE